jgi:3-phytase
MRRMLFTLVAIPAVATAQPATVSVSAKGETVPVGTANADAADDPAIWRNPANPAASLVVATDKKAGLHVYGLDGKSRHFVAAGRVNNVDLIDRGKDGVLVVASDRNDIENSLLQLYRLDTATAQLVSIGSVGGGAGEAYGVCLYDSGKAVYAFSVLKQGVIHQVKLDLSGAAPAGKFVRSMARPSQTEGCVVDPKTASVYVGEENVGIWRFSAREGARLEGKLVAAVDNKQLTADVEGLAIAEGRHRYLVASSQGDNAYALYRLPSMKPAGRFRIAPGTLGATEETDGIALFVGDFGPTYRGGLFVAQDGDNSPHPQNFKFVDWGDVVQVLPK